MTLLIHPSETRNTNELLATILSHAKQGAQVQFLVEPGTENKVVQRLRVALTRSRNRRKASGKKIGEFTLRHSSYPYTDSNGKRHSCIVMWIDRLAHHVNREILDDLLER